MIEMNGKTFACPIDLTLSLFGGKWKLLMLCHLYKYERCRYADIKSSHPGISEKMLCQQLRDMERDGLIAKTQLSAKPYRVEYFLTQTGISLGPMFEFVAQWGADYIGRNNIGKRLKV
jgi:DNA-binding HxlR family transcriptional regulator